MNDKLLKKIYRKAGKAEVEELFSFRAKHKSKTVISDGVKWEYLDCGGGAETLLLLPSGIHFGEMWFQVINALKDKYRIISPTYPVVSTITGITTGVKSILDREVINRVHLLGMSTSGWFAQCFVRHYPGFVESLMLTNTSGPGVIELKKLKKVRIFAALFPMLLMKLSHKSYYQSSSLPESKRLFLQAFLDDLRRRTPRNEILALYDCAIDYVANYRFRATDLDRWPGKVLIIESDNDEGYDRKMQADLRNLYPGAKVVTLHDAGHTPVFSKTEEFIRTLDNFL